MPEPLLIELCAPQTVNGLRAPYQSVWLLVRLHYAAQQAPHRPLVYADDLRERMSNARTLRMAITRAFQDFARWELAVGWGDDASRDPRFLNLEGRSQGPFWLAAHERQRIVCVVGGAPAGAAEIAAFLGLDRDGPGQGKALIPQRMVTQTDLSFWRHFVDGKQALREGRLLTPLSREDAAKTGGTGGNGGHDAPAALTAFRAARRLAASEFEHAFVALNEALLWRRLGDRAQTRKMLRALKRRRRGHAIAGNDYLDAMEGIVAAWCAYDERDLPGALAVLQALAQNQPSATLVQAHPHVRFEWHNLAALIQRSNALAAAPHDAATAGALAEQAATHFDQALAAAFESNVSDAAQHVAANIGMALWLFGEAGIGWSGALRDGEAERAIQWIGLSEWLGRGAGNRHPSAWNAIYLMRIARGACHTAPRPTLAEFQATAPIGVAALRQLAGPFADAFTGPAWPDSWHEVAAWRLAESQRGERKYPLLQQSSLWFELAWYSAHAGQLEPAAKALRLLREGLKQLAVSDRQYFGKPLLDALPEPVHRLAHDD